MPIGDFYDVTWGPVRLWCAEITTDNGRTQVIHELAEGDEHPTQDRGKTPGAPVDCELLWVEMPREAKPPLDRFRAFKKLVDDGEGPLLFMHPIDGAYYASVGAFKYTLDEDGNVSSCSVTFIRSAPAEAPITVGSGVSIIAGEAAIAARADELNAALESVDIESTIAADAKAAQASWQEADDVPTRQVIVDVADLSNELSNLIEGKGLENDLAYWDAYKAAIMMGDAIRSAALAALAETPKVTSILIREPISLLALCVRLYGGAEAEDRVRQVMSLNDIRTPGWIPTGTLITIPVPPRRRALAA